MHGTKTGLFTPALTSLMDEYVCFAWRTTAEPLN